MDWTTLIGPVLAAAVVAGVVSLVAAILNRATLLRMHAEKLVADREALDRRVAADIDMALQKLSADRDKTMSDKAWADYELRRDAYIEIARQIDCIFVDGQAACRPELHRMARRVRLVGCDHVVRTLNALFEAIRENQPQDALEGCYRSLFNAMRRDIRQVHTIPAEGTELDDDAFPIES